MSHLLVCTRLLLLLLLLLSLFLFVLRGFYIFLFKNSNLLCLFSNNNEFNKSRDVCVCEREWETKKLSTWSLFFIFTLIVQIEETALCMNPKQQRSIKYASRMQFKWRQYTAKEKKMFARFKLFSWLRRLVSIVLKNYVCLCVFFSSYFASTHQKK